MDATTSYLVPKMPTSMSRQLGLSDQEFRRGLVALPLLVVFVVASHVMAAAPAVPFALLHLEKGEIVWGDGGSGAGVPITDVFYNLPWLDKL